MQRKRESISLFVTTIAQALKSRKRWLCLTQNGTTATIPTGTLWLWRYLSCYRHLAERRGQTLDDSVLYLDLVATAIAATILFP